MPQAMVGERLVTRITSSPAIPTSAGMISLAKRSRRAASWARAVTMRASRETPMPDLRATRDGDYAVLRGNA